MDSTTSGAFDPFDTSICEETIHELYHYLDGELDEDKRKLIADHLDHCGPCVDVVSFEAELRRVIADHCREQIPEDLRRRIADLIHHEMTNGESAE